MNDDNTMTKLHTFRVVTAGDKDGAGASDKVVQAAAMGPFGGGVSVVDGVQVAVPLTVAEQKAPASAKAKAK